MKTLLLVILFSFYYHVVTPDIRFESLLHVYTLENLLLSVYTWECISDALCGARTPPSRLATIAGTFCFSTQE